MPRRADSDDDAASRDVAAMPRAGCYGTSRPCRRRRRPGAGLAGADGAGFQTMRFKFRVNLKPELPTVNTSLRQTASHGGLDFASAGGLCLPSAAVVQVLVLENLDYPICKGHRGLAAGGNAVGGPQHWRRAVTVTPCRMIG